MKSYTDLPQSKKLAEFLPLESADMVYQSIEDEYGDGEWESIPRNHSLNIGYDNDVPCWSLAALLDVIPYNITFNKAVYRFKLVKFSDHWECYHENFGTVSTNIFKADNQVDVCYGLILKLHEMNLL